MPSATFTDREGSITKFTNCRLVKGNDLVEQDLWVSSITGKILHGQQEFYGHHTIPDRVIDLGGRILAPGLIDVQLNGAFGFNFSTVPDDPASYGKTLRQVNQSLVTTGVTSYLPTVTSQRSDVYHQVLPFLGPSGTARRPEDGAESLGAHCEGPFLNPGKNGIHSPEVLIAADSFADIEACYGAANIESTPPRIRLITAAPEVGAMSALIPEITARDIIFSIGHSEATYEDASIAVSRGASMITHLFNAMRPLHHRNPGIFGVLGQPRPSPPTSTLLASTPTSTSLSSSSSSSLPSSSSSSTAASPPPTPRIPDPSRPDPRPYFGIIADGIHLHPSSITIAYNAHPTGMVLVTDAMHLVGLPDGVYDWSNGEKIVKRASRLTLLQSSGSSGSGSSDKNTGTTTTTTAAAATPPTTVAAPEGEGEGKIAGSTISLIECVNNFRNWSGATAPEALRAATGTPARLLGLAGIKGCLDGDADADLVVFGERARAKAREREAGEGGIGGMGNVTGGVDLVVEQVWKFGKRVF